MQRIDPRPVDPPAQSPSQPQAQSQSQDPQSQTRQLTLPTGFASTGSQAHTQSFEEIYGVPENFLEIEVCMDAASDESDYVLLGFLSANMAIGDRSTNTPTDLLAKLTLHYLPDPPVYQHTRLQATTVRSTTPVLRLRSLS